MQTALQHRQIVGSIDLFTMEITPDVLKLGDGSGEVVRFAGKDDRINSTSRRATDHSERIRLPFGSQFGDSLEHADLKGAAGTAAGHNESRFRVADSSRSHRRDRQLLLYSGQAVL